MLSWAQQISQPLGVAKNAKNTDVQQAYIAKHNYLCGRFMSATNATTNSSWGQRRHKILCNDELCNVTTDNKMQQKTQHSAVALIAYKNNQWLHATGQKTAIEQLCVAWHTPLFSYSKKALQSAAAVVQKSNTRLFDSMLKIVACNWW